MAARVETMAWTGETPWHGLGKKVSNNLTPEQMLNAAKLNWRVEKRPLTFASAAGKGQIKIPERFALVRDIDERLLSIVGPTYKPVQNDVSVGFFKKFVQAGHMKMETMGSLCDGQYIWALARLGVDFSIGKDEMRGFLLLCQPHVFGKAMIFQFTAVRVVCWNTLTFALGADLKGHGGGGSFRMPHSMEFTDKVRAKAEQALGLAKMQMKDLKAAATLLAKKRAKPEHVEFFFNDVLRFDPNKATKKKTQKKGAVAVIEPRMLAKLRHALNEAPGAQLPSAEGTWWGAVNAVTYVVDHHLGRDQSTALRTAWFAEKANIKRRAVNLALARAA